VDQHLAARLSSGTTFRDLLARIEYGDGRELAMLLNAVTVPHSWFFRDPEQLSIVESLLVKRAAARHRTRIWVAGCASGEDAYTLAMIALSVGAEVEVLGTDVNEAALARAKAGCYGRWSVRDVPTKHARWIARTAAGFEVTGQARNRITFERHNLVHRAPRPLGAPGWDLIVCRNVLIYFARSHAEATVERLADALAPGGWLLLGANDLVVQPPPQLSTLYVSQRLVFERASNPRPQVSAGVPTPEPLPAFVPASASAPKSATVPLEPKVAGPRSAPDIASDDMWSIVARANQRFELGDLPGALSLYGHASDLDPVAALPRFFSGLVHHFREDPGNAVNPLRASLFLDPAFWPASFYLALSYDRLGRSDDAIRQFESLLRAPPDPAVSLCDGNKLLGDIHEWRREVMRIARERTERGRRSP
jgi:chemotaxis protein methyltransferase CheR